MIVLAMVLLPALLLGAMGVSFLRIGRRSNRSDSAFVRHAVTTRAQVVAVHERDPNARYVPSADTAERAAPQALDAPPRARTATTAAAMRASTPSPPSTGPVHLPRLDLQRVRGLSAPCTTFVIKGWYLNPKTGDREQSVACKDGA